MARFTLFLISARVHVRQARIYELMERLHIGYRSAIAGQPKQNPVNAGFQGHEHFPF